MTSTKLKRFSVFAFAVVLLSSCANTAHIEKDPSTNLENYKTYSWIEKEGSNTRDKNHKNDIAELNLRNAVSKELQKNGLSENKRNPDILLTYDILVEKSVKEGRDPVYSRPYTRMFYNPYTRRYGTIHYPSQFLGYDNYRKPVKEGTITITMVDPKTDKTIWQGWATEVINSNIITTKEVQRNVRTIFRKFDVASR